MDIILEAKLSEKYTHLEGACQICHVYKPVRAVGLEFATGTLTILICQNCSKQNFKRKPKKGEFSIEKKNKDSLSVWELRIHKGMGLTPYAP